MLVAGPGGSVVVADSVFSNCIAAAWGGAIAVRGSATLEISRSNFTGNRAGEGGGAMHANASTLHVSSSRFESNSAGTRGGAVAITEGAVLDLSDALFHSNRVLVAEHYETGVAGGGAIFARDGCSTRVSGRSEFFDNTVPASTADKGTGGGVSLWAESTLLVEGPATFVRNSALYGGAVHAFDRSRSGPRSPRGETCLRCLRDGCQWGFVVLEWVGRVCAPSLGPDPLRFVATPLQNQKLGAHVIFPGSETRRANHL